MCTNTSITTPGKHFFYVPKKKKIGDKWCKVMKRKETLSDKSVRYCCEDHFDIYENPFLKYCSLCEHQLLKFYKFKEKCMKAISILKTTKRDKNRGYQTNLHKHLPPPSLGYGNPSLMKLFTLKDDQLEIKLQPLKVEMDFEVDDASTIQTDIIQHSFVETSELGRSHYKANIKEESINTYWDTNVAKPENVYVEEHTETNSFTNSESQECDKLKKNEVKQEHISTDSQDNNDSNDDSDNNIINEFVNRIQVAPKRKVIKKLEGKSSYGNKKFERQPLKNLEELEKVFDIQVFKSEEEAKQELESRKTSEPYISAEHKCEICYTVYKYAKLLQYHKKSHDPSSGDLVCSICSMRYTKKLALNKHQYAAHYGKFMCKRCPLITYHKLVFEAHYQKHTGVKYSCKKCGNTFNHLSTYSTHIRLRHKSEHVCVTCARTFVSKNGLIAHRNKIHRTKSLVDSDATVPCEACDLMFPNESVYTLHIKNTDKHKNLAQAIIACRTCGTRFENTDDLKQHRQLLHAPQLRRTDRVWTNGKLMEKCLECGAMGAGNRWLTHHFMHSHPESTYAAELARRRQFMCDTCGKSYTTIQCLRDHINTHTGARPYACADCPARFNSQSCLQNHSQLHRPASRECKQCGKKFVSSSNLNNHMRFHTQDRRYKCSLCHKGFLHSVTLRQHVRGVHQKVRRLRKVAREAQYKTEEQIKNPG